ncbi:hypothetical protein ACFL7D_11330 [candidate division KSB1 bacterium]
MYCTPFGFEIRGKGKIYRYLGVHFIGKIIPTGGIFWRRLTGMKMSSFSLGTSSLQGARAYLYKACFFELLHVSAFIFYMVIIIHRLNIGYTDLAIDNLQQNLIINVYPIMLQRYNRARIFHLLRRRSKTQQLVSQNNKTN